MKFMMAINGEDGTIEQMAKALGLNKSETVVLALNLLSYVLDQRKVGNHLVCAEEVVKTEDLLKEACAGSVKFYLGG